jgi:tyrosine-protein kinase Etk/Wzc
MEAREEKSQGLIDYVHVLWKRKVPIIIVFVLAVSSTLFYTIRMQPVYEAYTTVRIENIGVQGTLLSDLAALQRGNPIETEIEVIKSRSLAEQVVTALNLNFSVIAKSRDMTARLEELILSSDFPYGDCAIEILSESGAFELRRQGGERLGIGQVGQNFVTDGLSFRLVATSFHFGDSLVFRVADPVRAAAQIQTATTVGPVKGANIIRMSTRSGSPVLAAKIANELANQYLKQNLASARGEARSAREFIQEQLAVAADTLRDAEQKLREYKEKAKFILLDEDAKESISTLAKFEADREEARMMKAEAEKRLSLLRAQLSGEGAFAKYKSVAASPTVSSNPVVASLKSRLSDLEIRRAQLLEEYTERHPDVIDIENEIAKVKEELNESTRQVLESGPSSTDPVFQSIISGIIEAETEISALDVRVKTLEEIIGSYGARLEDLPEKEITLARLTRRKEVGEKVYTMLLTKLEEARISEAMKIGNIRIVDAAIPPERPILPKKKRTTMLGAVGGLVMGIALAFFLEYLDTSLKSGEDVEKDLGLAFLGSVPSVRFEKATSQDGSRQLKRLLITHFEPRSLIAEAYRTLRTNLQYVQLDRKCRTLLFTSPLPEEGKSTSLANISITLSQLGARTLIIDSDLRRPVQHSIFGIEKSPGLTGILVDDRAPDDAIVPTGHENLFLLPSGPIPPNPSELLGSSKMARLLEELKGRFDYILFDSPPLLAVTDAALLGGKLDGVILVVRSEKTDRRAAQEAKRLLENARARVLGAVLNDVKMAGYGYHYHYRSYYNYYGDQDKKGRRRKQPQGKA